MNESDLLRKVGLKVTEKRVNVLSLFNTIKKPITVGDFLDLYKQMFGSRLNQVTAYRIIQACTEGGLLKELRLSKNTSHYESAMGHDHHHITCTSCGIIEDIHICEKSSVVSKALDSSKHFTAVVSHTFELFGICKQCSK